MAVIVVHKNENVDAAIRRFQRQVVKEGIIADILKKRYFISKSEQRRIKKHEIKRAARRKRRRGNKKPRTSLSVKKKLF